MQGLRGVAVLLVVLYHAGVPHVGGGFVGVDVFFVISGFVITAQLQREVEATGRLRLSRFYARRVLRLLPAATTATAVTAVAAWYWLPATRLPGIARDVLFTATATLNLRLAALGADYRTSGAAPSPLQHFWSLGVEEQFYLVWPVLLIALAVRRRHRALLVAGILAIIGASLWWSVHLTARSAVWAYYGAPTRAWELAAGALIAVLAGTLARVPRWSATPLLRWAGLAAVGWSATHLGAATPYPGYHAVLPVAGAAAVIVAGCRAPGRSLAAGPLTWLGDHSYGWYLWHWPFLIIGPYALARPFGLREDLAAVAAALAAAVLTHHLVEVPIRNRRQLRDRYLAAGAAGVALTAGTLAVAVVLPLLPTRIPLGEGNVAQVVLEGRGTAATLALARRLELATRTAVLPENLTPALIRAASDTPDIYRNGCHLPFRQTTWPAACERLGEASSKTLMVLFGDSHAAQWYPAAATIAEQRHWRLAVFTKSACPAAQVIIHLDALARRYTECSTWRTAVLARIRELDPAVVITSSNADGGTPLDVPAGDVDGAWARAWSVTLRALVAPHRRVYYLNDTPWPAVDVPECLVTHPRDVQACARDTASATAGNRRGMIASEARRAGATTVDPTPWFCTLRRCPVVVGNLLVYPDASHVSPEYVRLVSGLLAEQVR